MRPSTVCDRPAISYNLRLMAKPKVIVVMPAYNAEKTLERTIKDRRTRHQG